MSRRRIPTGLASSRTGIELSTGLLVVKLRLRTAAKHAGIGQKKTS